MRTRELKKLIAKNGYACTTATKPYARCALSYWHGDLPLDSIGWSVCQPEDEWDENEGKGKAFARALNDMVKQVRALEATTKPRKRPRATLSGVYYDFDTNRIISVVDGREVGHFYPVTEGRP